MIRIEMYSLGKSYKFEMPNAIFYTGKILEEDNYSIKILSKFGEELILSKTSIVQSKRIEGDNSER